MVSILGYCWVFQAFFGVYDGHGGRRAADFVAEKLGQKIVDLMLKSEKEDCEIEHAVKAGYLEIDKEFLEEGVSSGACCVTALIKNGCLVVANAGDCRAVLSRNGNAESITYDHRPRRQEERERIENLGGYVDIHGGAWRVQGTLAVSRSIGDIHLKRWISAEPDIRKIPITSDSEFLIMASDGLWEKLQLEYMDLYLIHWPVSLRKGASHPIPKGEDFLPLDIKSVWRGLEQCVELGLTKSIGVSNFSCKKIEDLLTYGNIPPAVNQVEMHPLWQQKKLRDYCSNVNIHVSAYSPLGSSGTYYVTNAAMENTVVNEGLTSCKQNPCPAL